jgi:hypothetical protein
MTTTGPFPHVYIIHLPRRTNRYEQFQSAWSAAGLPESNLHWFDAVEGVKLPPTAFTGFHTVARTHKARAGRLGAYLSHTGAIAAAIAANHFPLLILEDDAVPTDTLSHPDTLRVLFATAPPHANLLYLGALPVKDRKADKDFCRRRITRKHPRRWSSRAPTPAVKLYGGHAYGFPTAAAAQHVLSELLTSRITFDSALVRYQKKFPEKVAFFCPFVFRQAEGFSNIEGITRWRSH